MSLPIQISRVRSELRALLRAFDGSIVYSSPSGQRSTDRIVYEAQHRRLVLPSRFNIDLDHNSTEFQLTSIELALELSRVSMKRLVEKHPLVENEHASRSLCTAEDSFVEFTSHYYALVYLVTSFPSSLKPKAIGYLSEASIEELRPTFAERKRAEVSTFELLGTFFFLSYILFRIFNLI